jgi:uncharacterized membrane protein YeaQ/YmgE (transglycosylase-associated protein family)
MLIFAGLVVILVLLLLALLALVHSIIGLILFVVIAGLCAALAEYVLHVREGVFTTVVVGLIGAAIGVIIQHIFRLPTLLAPFGVPIVWTILGSIIVVAILRLVLGNRRLRWV